MAGQTLKFSVSHLWDGQKGTSEEVYNFELIPEKAGLTLKVDAPFFDDPAPPSPAGSTPELWSYEVVELFILGANNHYTEVEIGPFGHYLLLKLEGERQVKSQGDTLPVTTFVWAGRWSASLTLTWEQLPMNTTHLNAYAIHGEGKNRRHLALSPNTGPHPDFHQLSSFLPIKTL